VFRAIARLKVPVRLRDIRKDPEAARKLVAEGGEDQVPCLLIDGRPLYESADIIRYLEENFAQAPG